MSIKTGLGCHTTGRLRKNSADAFGFNDTALLRTRLQCKEPIDESTESEEVESEHERNTYCDRGSNCESTGSSRATGVQFKCEEYFSICFQLVKKWGPRSICLLTFLLLIFYAFLDRTHSEISSSKTHHDTRDDLYTKISEIKTQIAKQFPEQDDKLWSIIFGTTLQGLSRDPSRPIVLLLLNRGDDQEEKTSNCLVSMVAEEVSKIMEVEQPDPIIVDGSNYPFSEERITTFVSYFKSLVERQGTLVLKHLENLPSDVAQNLHYFCDVENPLVRKSLFLFTMSVESSEFKPTTAAENYLKKLWNGKIKYDSLEALVTRLTDQVAFIRAEKLLPISC